MELPANVRTLNIEELKDVLPTTVAYEGQHQDELELLGHGFNKVFGGGPTSVISNSKPLWNRFDLLVI